MIKLLLNDHNITDKVVKVTWSGQNEQVTRSLAFETTSTPFDSAYSAPDVDGGDTVMFYVDGKLKFEGRVMNITKKSEVGTVEFTAYDYLYNLVQSSATYKFKNKSPEFICRSVCHDFDITVVKVPKTKYKIKKYIPSQMSPYNIILKAFQKAEKKTKKKYMIYMVGTDLNVITKGTLIDFKISGDSNLETSEYSKDATQVINKVVVYNAKGQKIGTYSTKSSVSKYGIMQSAVNVDKGKGKKEAKNTLKNAEESASVTCTGDARCISGYAITIDDESTELTGKYYIKSDTHEFANGIYTMMLELSKKNEDEEISYEKIDENSSKYTNSDGSVTKIKTKKYKAIFTAYDEHTGKGKDCKGHKLNASKHTCAMGKSIAKYGSKVTVSLKGSSIDGKTYKVTDVPKHARLKGKVHVDILFKTNAEAKAFGVKTGTIKVVTKTIVKSAADAKGDKIGKKIIDKAESKKGCKYVWGASGPNTFDCSGLVWWCHKQCGINFGRTNTQGLSKLGKKVAYSEMEAGDVILFSSNGAYSGIHHTGLYIGNGVFIHAPNHKEVVKESSVSSGYYRKQFYTARRIR